MSLRQSTRFAAAIKELLLSNSNAAVLVELLSLTNDSYGIFLKEAMRIKGEETPFSPWDVRYVMRKIDDEIESEFSLAYPRMNLEFRVLKSFAAMGFLEAGLRIVFLESRDQMILDGKPGLYIELLNDPSRIQFGSTKDFGLFGVARAEVNVSKDGDQGYRILFHECGHGLHFLSIQSRYHSLRMAMPSFFTEAVAKVFESLPLDTGWLSAHTTLSIARIRRLQRLRALQDLYYLRENIMFAMAEMTIGQTGEDTSKILYALAKVVLYPGCEEERISALNGYMSRAVFHPNSAFNVVLTACLAAQMRAAATDADGDTIYTERTQAALRPFIEPGGSLRWQDVMIKSTGADLDIETVAHELGRKAKYER